MNIRRAEKSQTKVSRSVIIVLSDSYLIVVLSRGCVVDQVAILNGGRGLAHRRDRVQIRPGLVVIIIVMERRRFSESP